MAKKGAATAPPISAIFRRRSEKSTISPAPKTKAASEFLVPDITREIMPKINRKRYQARFLARPKIGKSRHSATKANTAPEVPTLLEASTGTTPVSRPPSIASLGQIGRLIQTPARERP